MSHCYEPDREHQSLQDTIICNLCVHKYPGRKCKAFPEEIPIEILRDNAHFKSIPGDNGIVFEPIKTTDSPFYSPANQAALQESARQLQEGRVVTKTPEELEAMENG